VRTRLSGLTTPGLQAGRTRQSVPRDSFTSRGASRSVAGQKPVIPLSLITFPSRPGVHARVVLGPTGLNPRHSSARKEVAGGARDSGISMQYQFLILAKKDDRFLRGRKTTLACTHVLESVGREGVRA